METFAGKVNLTKWLVNLLFILSPTASKMQKTGKRLTTQTTPPGTWTPPITMSSLSSRDVPGAVG